MSGACLADVDPDTGHADATLCEVCPTLAGDDIRVWQTSKTVGEIRKKTTIIVWVIDPRQG
jgi:hypothetical protein